MKLESLKDLLVEQLQDLYDAENRITKALPKMAKAATSPDLKAAFEKHLKETEGQVKRLEQAFEALGEKAKKKTCQAIKGLIEEGEEVMKKAESGPVCDAGMIGVSQAIEHYEMARYGTLIAWARQLGLTEATSLLEETLKQEKKADATLNDIALHEVNRKAA